MRTLFLAPHSDDETLFGAFTIIRFKPDVIVCTVDPNREAAARRSSETYNAMNELVPGLSVREWSHREGTLDLETVKMDLTVYAPPRFEPLAEDVEVGGYDAVFAPFPEPTGHDEHNAVGLAALEVFGPERTAFYATYTRTDGRTQAGEPVPFTADMLARKLRALSMYESQMAPGNGSRSWFIDMLDAREWIVG